MLFKELSLIEPLLRALETEGYEQPTPIQEQAIPIVLSRRDLLGCAQTGTGKTAAFALPMLQIFSEAKNQPAAKGRPIRALILTPTRELAIQIGESFSTYGKNLQVRNLVIFGGVGQTPQTDALRRGTDVLIATPGRLLDLMNQGYVSLRDVEIFVLDEADRMLDMGFIHDVKKVIAKLPTQRQTLFFSATMPDEISNLANSILTNPLRVEVTPASTTAEKVEQAVYFVDKQDKRHLLVHLLKDQGIRSALVFTRTKHGANKVAADVSKAGIFAEAIHGNKSQSARQAALHNFKTGRTRVLIATDIAARGIDIDELSHVVNYELPNIPETYVHRIGRTGRAGLSGIALSFCEAEEIPYLKDIQKLTGQLVPVVTDHPYAADLTAPGIPQPQQRKEKGGQKPQVQKVPAPQRPDMIPMPQRRPDTIRTGQQPRNENRPSQAQLAENQEQISQRNEGRPNEQRHEQRNDGLQRRNDRPQREQRDGSQNRQQQGRPQGGNQQQRPNRDGDRPKPQPQRPQQQSKPDGKPSTADVASAMRNRFASILEVSAIEKQERPPKPKPDYRDRDRNREPDNRTSSGGGNRGGGNNRNNRGGGGRGR